MNNEAKNVNVMFPKIWKNKKLKKLRSEKLTSNYALIHIIIRVLMKIIQKKKNEEFSILLIEQLNKFCTQDI